MVIGLRLLQPDHNAVAHPLPPVPVSNPVLQNAVEQRGPLILLTTHCSFEPA